MNGMKGREKRELDQTLVSKKILAKGASQSSVEQAGILESAPKGELSEKSFGVNLTPLRGDRSVRSSIKALSSPSGEKLTSQGVYNDLSASRNYTIMFWVMYSLPLIFCFWNIDLVVL